jgi:hypothetical protein
MVPSSRPAAGGGDVISGSFLLYRVGVCLKIVEDL